MAEPLLVPVPRDVDLSERRLPDDVAITEIVDPSLPPQGYELTLTESAVTLQHADDAGRRYGLQTLEQLQREGLRAGRVRDWPDLAHRGLMLDISRDRVPDRACLLALLDRMARVRLNHLELYTEHTFAYADHEDVWRDASPMTREDVRWLEGEAAARGIDLVANQNCFGHFERWLRLDRYRPRAIDPSAARPLSLAPTEDNARFALDLVAELTDIHTNTAVNIGCDEVFELHGDKDRFIEHLGRLLDGTRALGRHPRFWADMIHGDPCGRRRPRGRRHRAALALRGPDGGELSRPARRRSTWLSPSPRSPRTGSTARPTSASGPGPSASPMRASTGGSAPAPAAGTRWSGAGPTLGPTPSTPCPVRPGTGPPGSSSPSGATTATFSRPR